MMNNKKLLIINFFTLIAFIVVLTVGVTYSKPYDNSTMNEKHPVNKGLKVNSKRNSIVYKAHDKMLFVAEQEEKEDFEDVAAVKENDENQINDGASGETIDESGNGTEAKKQNKPHLRPRQDNDSRQNNGLASDSENELKRSGNNSDQEASSGEKNIPSSGNENQAPSSNKPNKGSASGEQNDFDNENNQEAEKDSNHDNNLGNENNEDEETDENGNDNNDHEEETNNSEGNSENASEDSNENEIESNNSDTNLND